MRSLRWVRTKIALVLSGGSPRDTALAACTTFAGPWPNYDAWDAGRRAAAVCDLHQGFGACSVLRTFQGWLSMRNVGPNEGTSIVYPLVKLVTVYTLLQPFFQPIKPLSRDGILASDFLSPGNWVFT